VRAILHSGGTSDAASFSLHASSPEEVIVITSENPWEELKEKLHFNTPHPWIGYISYEMGAYADQDIKLPRKNPKIPLAWFMRASKCVPFTPGPPPPLQASTRILKPFDPYSLYREKILSIQQEILRGDVYQVNLSHEMILESDIEPYPLFLNLIEKSPAPFAAFLDTGEFTFVSHSPERLLRKKGNTLETRPIKGTAPSSVSPQTLLSSEKNLAELFMITDLMRSDLGRISEPSSVHVKELLRCESYPHVHHLLSIIESRALNKHPVDLLRHIFPGGSVTGCPKLAAMESIYRHESAARGLYTGSIGYFSPNGDFDFNIAIRTLTFHNSHITLNLGGGITIDSDPHEEYQETMHKGKHLLSLLGHMSNCIN
jgi:para-aminobenzoate synthetase component 1